MLYERKRQLVDKDDRHMTDIHRLVLEAIGQLRNVFFFINKEI